MILWSVALTAALAAPVEDEAPMAEPTTVEQAEAPAVEPMVVTPKVSIGGQVPHVRARDINPHSPSIGDRVDVALNDRLIKILFFVGDDESSRKQAPFLSSLADSLVMDDTMAVDLTIIVHKDISSDAAIFARYHQYPTLADNGDVFDAFGVAPGTAIFINPKGRIEQMIDLKEMDIRELYNQMGLEWMIEKAYFDTLNTFGTDLISSR